MLRHHNNTAPPVTLDVSVDDADTTLDVGDTTGYPPVPFILAIDRGSANEELCLATAKDATTFTVERGYDGTQASSHSDGVTIEHVSAAIDYREGYIPRVNETERDALAGDELWDGRAIFNTDSKRLEIAYPGGGWDQIVPTGAVLPFGGDTVPAGFLLCNGQVVSRDDYSGLFAVIGTAYGAGDGSTTFGIPDLRQRFPLGKADSGTGDTLGETGGDIDHTHLQTAHTHSLSNHTHSNPNVNSSGSHTHSQGNTGSAGSHNHSINSSGSEFYQGTDRGINSAGSHTHSNPNVNSSGSHSHSQGDTGSAGSGDTGDGSTTGATDPTGSANPPYLVVNFIIRT